MRFAIPSGPSPTARSLSRIEDNMTATATTTRHGMWTETNTGDRILWSPTGRTLFTRLGAVLCHTPNQHKAVMTSAAKARQRRMVRAAAVAAGITGRWSTGPGDRSGALEAGHLWDNTRGGAMCAVCNLFPQEGMDNALNGASILDPESVPRELDYAAQRVWFWTTTLPKQRAYVEAYGMEPDPIPTDVETWVRTGQGNPPTESF